LRAVFHLPTVQAVSFRQGDQLQLRLVESNENCPAVVDYVSPITRADSGRVRIEMLIDNGDSKYRSGVRCVIVDRNLAPTGLGQSSSAQPVSNPTTQMSKAKSVLTFR
jgi:hypothetical protein